MTYTITDDTNYTLEANENGVSVSCAIISFNFWEVNDSENIISQFMRNHHNTTNEDPREGIEITKDQAIEFVAFAKATTGYKFKKINLK